MKEDSLRDLLTKVKHDKINIEGALKKLKTLPYEDLGFAKVDNHRCLRKGVPEIIYGAGKTTEQIISIIDVIVKSGNDAVVTRTDEEVYRKVKKKYKKAVYHKMARMIVIDRKKKKKVNRGLILVASAGTSDIPVAEEAAVTSEVLGNRVERLYDVGVAGVHRLLDNMELLTSATVLIVVAGMEGALPSIIGGLVDKPVIAVPTSVGYGMSFNGISALLGMLNSCASGIVVVNIDNGFGAGYSAHLINSLHTV
jgi:NCAIR mutase (PurE)-related protein